MKCWRIAHRKYALDTSCFGTRQFGGRWNSVGTPALYCSTSIALCALEKFVHVGVRPWPPLLLVAVVIPDDRLIFRPVFGDLPLGWDALPGSPSAQMFGKKWFAAGAQLAMSIPSALVHEERNLVVNPRRADFDKVLLAVVRPFAFDPRMGK